MSEPNKMKDDPCSAPESGDPLESGRDRGQVVAKGANRKVKDESGGTGEEFECGRQDAAPRTGD
ncbi:MAG TPA: hypothetical protein VH475_21425 [Tepidisphaeraceae bacterium]|jgi:hypothetical protein